MAYSIEEKLIRVNEHTRPGAKINVLGVVIHWTANEGVGAGRMSHYRYFNRGVSYASAHYFVDDGGILRIIPENEMAYHVGAQSYKTTRFGTYPNGHLIGIEMCVNSDGDFSETYKRAVWLAADILRRHGLNPEKDLVRHFDITGKDCPKMFVTNSFGYKYMDMSASNAYSKFNKDVRAILAGKGITTVKPAAKPSVEKPTSHSEVTSVVDWLKLNNRPYSFESREKLAHEYGIDNYTGSVEDNIELLRSLRKGDPKPAKKPVKQPKPKKCTVTLPASAATWKTYRLDVQPVSRNSDWSLTPAAFGGIEYEILDRPYPDVVTVKTSKGERNIYVAASTGAIISECATKSSPKEKSYNDTLKSGDSGAGVKEMQENLAKVYYYPNKGAKNNGINGKYDKHTVDAVKRFQSYYGLKEDGIFGSTTRSKLNKAIK